MRLPLYLAILTCVSLCPYSTGISQRTDTSNGRRDTSSRSLGDGRSQSKTMGSQNNGLAEGKPVCNGKREWMKCESWSFKYNTCRSTGGRIKSAHMGKRLSKTACIRGDNWGLKDGNLWVNSGCRATFRLCFEDSDNNTDRRLLALLVT